MARCILALSLCFTFAVPFVWSRRISPDNRVASAFEAQLPQDGIEQGHTMSTIFVRGFDYNTDEAAMNKHFGAVGAIKNLHFQSRGSAVITYEEPSSATQAVNELHETTLEGQSRYVEVKLDDPDRERKGDKGEGKGKDKGKTKGSGKGGSGASGRTIFVTGFDFETDDDALSNHFGTVGAIEDIRFQSKRSAIITYDEASAAQQALTKLDGSTMSGQSRNVAVKLYDPRPAKGSEEDLKGSGKVAGTDSGRAIYVQGFEYDTDEAALEKHFGDVGTIESCYFQSKIGAVVTFVEAASAQRAVAELDGTIMTGQTRYVAVKLDNSLDKGSKTAGAALIELSRPATGSGEDRKGSGKVAGTDSGRAIYVHGFNYDTDEAALEKHFGDVGTIESYYRQSKIGAVVTFVEAASAQRAVAELNGSTMSGQTRYVAVKLDNSLDKASNTAGGKGK